MRTYLTYVMTKAECFINDIRMTVMTYIHMYVCMYLYSSRRAFIIHYAHAKWGFINIIVEIMKQGN